MRIVIGICLALMVLALSSGCDFPRSTSTASRYEPASARYPADTAAPERLDTPVVDRRGSESAAAPPAAIPPERPRAPHPPVSAGSVTPRPASIVRDSPLPPTPGTPSQSAPTSDPDGISNGDVRSSSDSWAVRVRQEEREDLDRRIREYLRARRAFVQSEVSYGINVLMAVLKAGDMLSHGTPVSFNPLPVRDRLEFRELVHAAENLARDLRVYLAEFATAAEVGELEEIQDEVKRVIEMTEPGTGNAVLDFLRAIESGAARSTR